MLRFKGLLALVSVLSLGCGDGDGDSAGQACQVLFDAPQCVSPLELKSCFNSTWQSFGCPQVCAQDGEVAVGCGFDPKVNQHACLCAESEDPTSGGAPTTTVSTGEVSATGETSGTGTTGTTDTTTTTNTSDTSTTTNTSNTTTTTNTSNTTDTTGEMCNPIGDPCTIQDDCCGFDSEETICVSYDDEPASCEQQCDGDADCASDCCYSFADKSAATCSPDFWCPNQCMAPFEPCTVNYDCCGASTADAFCVMADIQMCMPRCETAADCTTACCVNIGPVDVCAPAEYC